MSVEVRRAVAADFEGIWTIFHEVVVAGDTFPFTPDTPREEAFRVWMEIPIASYVAVEDGGILGTYYLKPNQPGLGSHVCNAGYAVASAARSRGIGKALGRHSLIEARRLGFEAMQFNLVVATNQPSVALWRNLGFSIIGVLPKAFRHQQFGLVDALVMYRLLDDP